MDVNSPALQPRGLEKVAKLIDKGARIPNPLTVDIDDGVDVDNISGDGSSLAPDVGFVAVARSSPPGACSATKPP